MCDRNKDEDVEEEDDDSADEGENEAEEDLKQPDGENQHHLNKQIIGQRTKDAAKKVSEYGQYLQFMEERVASLEATMRKVSEVELKEDEGSGTRRRTVPELRRVRWAEFKHKLKDDRLYAVEALVGEVRFYYQRLRRPRPARGFNYLDEAPIISAHDTQLPSNWNPNQRDPVWRIRINAIPVLRIVSEITDFDWPAQSVVLLYPFKLFVNRHSRGHEKT